jgi:REP element-mobilizing transposase RayT
MISRTRGYLPHLQTTQATYFVTFRLADSLPSELLFAWKEELQLNRNRCKGDKHRLLNFERQYISKVEKHLDSNGGACWLKDPRVASLVSGALRYFNSERYFLYAWTIMPNHVHVLFDLYDSFKLEKILHSWKSYTVHEINKILGRSGRLWEPEYFDRLIRSKRHFEFCVRYVLNNPVKAGLCERMEQWPWSGCAGEIQDEMKRFF